jgi:hypothetical protein
MEWTRCDRTRTAFTLFRRLQWSSRPSVRGHCDGSTVGWWWRASVRGVHVAGVALPPSVDHG